MPRFEIIEDQILDNPEEYAKFKSVNTTRINKGGKSTLNEFFKNLQKEAFTSLKKKRCEKSRSIYRDKMDT
jgi:predicted DNA-binding WGR domain protein